MCVCLYIQSSGVAQCTAWAQTPALAFSSCGAQAIYLGSLSLTFPHLNEENNNIDFTYLFSLCEMGVSRAAIRTELVLVQVFRQCQAQTKGYDECCLNKLFKKFSILSIVNIKRVELP